MKDHFDWAKEQGFIPQWWTKVPERSVNEETKEKAREQEAGQKTP